MPEVYVSRLQSEPDCALPAPSACGRLRQEFECQSGDVIVLACDGVFDVLSSSKARSLCANSLLCRVA